MLFLVDNIQERNGVAANMFYWFKDHDHDFNEFKMSHFRAAQFKQARPLTIVVAMRGIKFVFLFALLLCSMGTYLVVAQGRRTGYSNAIRFAVILLLNSHICAKGSFDIRIIFPS